MKMIVNSALSSMNNMFPVLAIETSDNICGASVYFNKEKYFSSKIILKPSHSEKIFDAIDTAIRLASIDKTEIKSIAVSGGPGSFTGLRIGMSAAKGVAQSLSIPIIVVPTFEAFAYQLCSVFPESTEIIIANKVGRDELYFAKFQLMSNNYIFKEDLKIIPLKEFNSLSKDVIIFGNVTELNSGALVNLKNISAPDPEYIAMWAENFGTGKEINDIDFIEPNYFKDFIVKEKKK